jgi:hypothetical protein
MRCGRGLKRPRGQTLYNGLIDNRTHGCMACVAGHPVPGELRQMRAMPA